MRNSGELPQGQRAPMVIGPILKYALLVIGSVALFIAVPIGLFIVYDAHVHRCEIRTFSSIASPNNKWTALKLEKFCNEDDYVPLWLALVPANEPFNEDAVFSTSKQDDNNQENVVLTQWLDDSTLLVATPAGYPFYKTLPSFHGVTIHYESYPDDPDQGRAGATKSVMAKYVTFHFRFESNDGYGDPGLGCDLYAEGPDGDYLKDIGMRISSGKSFYSADKSISSSILIWSSEEMKKPTGVATSARVETRSVGATTYWAREDNYGHAWQLHHTVNSTDLLTVIEQLKNGGLVTKVGFWLDDTEVIYTSVKSDDLEAIHSFEQCLAQLKTAKPR